ncbi:MAG: NUDIX hydrolase [Chloroflexi bacterium]|nr:NUDIX hydrolase [Chloroflexota bacterium]
MRGSAKSNTLQPDSSARPQHPLAASFCPMCGGALHERQPESEDRPRLVCIVCNHIHYQNPKLVVAALPLLNGRVVLLRRGIPPRLGFWTFPSGFMELGETAEDAAVRETKEETNLDIRIRSLLNVYSRAEIGIVNIVYLADVIGGEVRLNREADEIVAFSRDAVPWDDLAFITTGQALRDWRDGTGPMRR